MIFSPDLLPVYALWYQAIVFLDIFEILADLLFTERYGCTSPKRITFEFGVSFKTIFKNNEMS
jgi:hypothetical protein